MDSEPKINTNDDLKISTGFDLQSINSDIECIKNAIRLGSKYSLEITTKKEWQYIAEKYAFIGFLIDQKIVLYWVKGNVKKKDSPAAYARMRRIIENVEAHEHLYHILDLSHITSFSLSARKAYEDITKALAPHWRHSYYVLSNLGMTIFRIYSAIHSDFSLQVTLAKSLTEAIDLSQQKIHQNPESLPLKSSFDPHTASHQDLLAEYLKLSDQHENLHHLQKKRAKKLLEMVGNISWKEDFNLESISNQQDDAFYNVFGALNLLQYDLKEIFNKQKALNKTLEKEVVIRTNQLAAVIENTSEMIMSVDRNWQVQVINSAFSKRFERTYGQVLKSGDFLLAKYPEHIKIFWQERFEKAFNGENYTDMISEMVNQEKTYLQITFNPIFENGQDVKEVSVFGQDITNLRKAEDKAKEYEGDLVKALKIARAGSWEFDLQTRMVKIGKEGLNILGLTEKKDFIISFEEFQERFLHPDDIPILQEKLRWAEQHENDPDFQDQFPYRLYHQNGKVLHLMLYSHYKANAPKVIFGISQDITEQKNAEEKLLNQNIALKKVNSELDQFVYSVSHDLRAPLTSVLGLINIAREEHNHDILMHYLDLQEKSIQKLDEFIREIMDLSKNARLILQKEAVDFQQMVEDVFEEQQYDQNTANIKKHRHINQKADFFTDPKRVRVILRNLISNALRYSNPNQPQPFVGVNIVVNATETIIVVEDNGVGIHPDHQGRIYDMFYRANQNKSGSGLGLYIVKETVDKLKGSIRLNSEPGKFTKFTVNLPNLG